MIGWSTEVKIESVEQEGVSAIACVYSGSPWFSGHFPDDPVLPGIAQLAVVLDLIKKVTGKQLKISRVRRVRFKHIIRPGETFQMVLKEKFDDKYSYSFKIMLKNEVACSGFIFATETE
jgi:3-hydroxymyristoyl/3-hydroxydecanoyl-(acyl carrier protein) dehydratase